MLKVLLIFTQTINNKKLHSGMYTTVHRLVSHEENALRYLDECGSKTEPLTRRVNDLGAAGLDRLFGIPKGTTKPGTHISFFMAPKDVVRAARSKAKKENYRGKLVVYQDWVKKPTIIFD